MTKIEAIEHLTKKFWAVRHSVYMSNTFFRIHDECIAFAKQHKLNEQEVKNSVLDNLGSWADPSNGFSEREKEKMRRLKGGE